MRLLSRIDKLISLLVVASSPFYRYRTGRDDAADDYFH